MKTKKDYEKAKNNKEEKEADKTPVVEVCASGSKTGCLFFCEDFSKKKHKRK